MYRLISNLKHNGRRYKAGELVDLKLSDTEEASLMAVKAIKFYEIPEELINKKEPIENVEEENEKAEEVVDVIEEKKSRGRPKKRKD